MEERWGGARERDDKGAEGKFESDRFIQYIDFCFDILILGLSDISLLLDLSYAFLTEILQE